jgi:hypothetical protein
MLLGGSLCSLFAARPYLTDDPGINEPGKFEFMAACDFWDKKTVPSLQLRHGITERMDFGVNVGYCLVPNEDRKASCADINFKYAIIPNLFSATFTGSFGDPGYMVNAVFGKSFGPVAINANIGYSAKADTQDVDVPYFIAVIFEQNKFGIGPEIGGDLEGLNWWQIGGRVYFTDWLHWDIGVGGDFKTISGYNATTGIDIVFQ